MQAEANFDDLTEFDIWKMMQQQQSTTRSGNVFSKDGDQRHSSGLLGAPMIWSLKYAGVRGPAMKVSAVMAAVMAYQAATTPPSREQLEAEFRRINPNYPQSEGGLVVYSPGPASGAAGGLRGPVRAIGELDTSPTGVGNAVAIIPSPSGEVKGMGYAWQTTPDVDNPSGVPLPSGPRGPRVVQRVSHEPDVNYYRPMSGVHGVVADMQGYLATLPKAQARSDFRGEYLARASQPTDWYHSTMRFPLESARFARETDNYGVTPMDDGGGGGGSGLDWGCIGAAAGAAAAVGTII